MEKAHYDSELKAIVSTFSGMPSLDEFKEGANSAIDLLIEHKTSKMLNDISKLELNSIENQEWTQKEWFPRAEKGGLKYFAFVMAAEIFGQVSAEQTNEKAEDAGNIEIKYFDKEEEAHNWLNTK